MIFRWIFGLPFAALVTVFLFLGMQGLISQDVEAGVMEKPPVIDILPKIVPTKTTKTKTPRPAPVAAPEPIKTPVSERQKNPGGDAFELLKGPVDAGIPDIITGSTTPTVKVPPAYPEGCRAKGAQGTVIVEFDVTADGNVTNPRIISSPNSCFDRTVMRAVQSWHYTPRVVDGRAVPQRGVREAFNFQLTE